MQHSYAEHSYAPTYINVIFCDISRAHHVEPDRSGLWLGSRLGTWNSAQCSAWLSSGLSSAQLGSENILNETIHKR